MLLRDRRERQYALALLSSAVILQLRVLYFA
jgi:hypothetical protein